MYCVQWNTRKARPAKKSLGVRYPATGRSWNPVVPNSIIDKLYLFIFHSFVIKIILLSLIVYLRFKKTFTSCNCGILSSLSIKYEAYLNQLCLISFDLILRRIFTYSYSISPVLANFPDIPYKHVSDKADAIRGKRFPYKNWMLFIDKF